MRTDAHAVERRPPPLTRRQLPDRAVLLLGLFGLVGVWLLFVTVFSDVYQNASPVAPWLAVALLVLALIAARCPQAAMVATPSVFVVGILLSHLPLVAEGSPRALLPIQMILAMALGAGAASWRIAARSSRQWAVGLLALGTLLGLQAQWHSSLALSQTYWGIPMGLGAMVAAVVALVQPQARRLAAGYVVAGLIVVPWVIIGVFQYGRTDVEIGTFSINFLSALLGLALVACAVLWAAGGKGWPVAGGAILILAVTLANSKTTLLAVLGAGAAIIWMHRSWNRSLRVALSVGLIAGIAVAFLLPSLLLSRASGQAPLVPGTRTVGDASMSSRLRVDLARTSAPNALQSPLLGLGQERNIVYYGIGDDGSLTWSRTGFPDATGQYAPHTLLIGLPTAVGLPLAGAVASIWLYAGVARRRQDVRLLMVPLVVYVAVSALTIDWDRSHMAGILWLPVGLLLAAKEK